MKRPKKRSGPPARGPSIGVRPPEIEFELNPVIDEREVKVHQAAKNCPRKPTGNCPVQLVFKDRRPFLRLCAEPSKPGYLMPVSSVSDGMAKGDEACGCWRAKRLGVMRECWPNQDPGTGELGGDE